MEFGKFSLALNTRSFSCFCSIFHSPNERPTLFLLPSSSKLSSSLPDRLCNLRATLKEIDISTQKVCREIYYTVMLFCIFGTNINFVFNFRLWFFLIWWFRLWRRYLQSSTIPLWQLYRHWTVGIGVKSRIWLLIWVNMHLSIFGFLWR